MKQQLHFWTKFYLQITVIFIVQLGLTYICTVLIHVRTSKQLLRLPRLSYTCRCNKFGFVHGYNYPLITVQQDIYKAVTFAIEKCKT